MRESAGRILRIVCYGLAALLAWRMVLAIIHGNPLRGVSIPAVPSLPGETNAPAIAKGTNPTAAPADFAKKGTNAPGGDAAKVSSNAPSIAGEPLKLATNVIAIGTAGSGTTVTLAAPGQLKAATNIVLQARSEKDAARPAGETNSIRIETNGAVRVAAKPAAKAGAAPGPDAAMLAMNSARGGRGGKPADLPPAIKARVDRIYDSEILGQVMHPLPMALLGIAGNTAFLRSSSGQTGLVKEGDQLGELKLLKIGINRVLIEQDGEKKELMIFSGYGGESLLPKPQESSK